jgi:hypothetical protein
MASSAASAAACSARRALEPGALRFEAHALVVELGDRRGGAVDAELRALGEPARVVEPAHQLAVSVRAPHELVEPRLQIGEPARGAQLGVEGSRPVLPRGRALGGRRDLARARLVVGRRQRRELALDLGEPRCHRPRRDRPLALAARRRAVGPRRRELRVDDLAPGREPLDRERGLALGARRVVELRPRPLDVALRLERRRAPAVHGHREHLRAGLVDRRDLALEPPRLGDLAARARARLEVRAHPGERVAEPGLLLEEEAAQLAGQRARDAARHAGAQHLVQLAALLVGREPHRRDPAVEQLGEVVLDRAKRLHRAAGALDRGAQLVELRHVIAVVAPHQQQLR